MKGVYSTVKISLSKNGEKSGHFTSRADETGY